MLSAMNEKSKGIGAKILLGLLFMSFAVWGVEGMVFNGGGGYVAKVGSKKIAPATLDYAVRKERAMIQAQLGANFNPEVFKAMRVERQILKKLVNDSLLNQEAERIGIIISDAEIARIIQGNAVFKDVDGKFSKQRFQEILQNNELTEAAYVELIRRDMTMKLLLNSFSAAVPASDFAAKTLTEMHKEERTADFYVISSATLDDQSAPTDEDLQAFYDKNSAAYTVPEYRRFSYVILDTKKMEDSHDVANQLEDALAGGATLKEAASRQKLTVLSTGPLDATGKLANGTKADIPGWQNFLRTAFSLEENTDSSVVRGDEKTFFLVHMDEVKPAGLKPFADVRAEIEKLYLADKKNARMRELADKINKAMSDPTTREAALKEYKLQPVTANKITITQKEAAGLKLPIPLVQDLFNLSKNAATAAYPMDNGNYIMGVMKERFTHEVSDKAQISAAKKLLEDSLRNELLEEYLTHLADKYGVKVNESVLARFQSES